MTIKLTKGFSTQVDAELFEFLNRWKWHYNSGYAERKENGKHIRMHQVVLGFKGVDHRNGDKLDNRKANLRKCDHSTNAMNVGKVRGASIYKGVSKDGNKWRVQIWKNNKRVFSESAPTERLAGLIYSLWAREIFGEFARLDFNIINPPPNEKNPFNTR